MSLSNKYQYTVLCEDKQTQSFMRSFLKEAGVPKKRIICLPLPRVGSGKNYVLNSYPRELHLLRRKKFNRRVLVICMDCDVDNVKESVQLLIQSCEKADVKPREDSETVFLVLPKRNIETWIVAIEKGLERVDELTDYGHFRGLEGQKGKNGEEFYKLIKNEELMKGIDEEKFSSIVFLRKEENRLEECQSERDIDV